jgi:brefeldin A-resistance guanine nucleotide exchange factor 1
MDLGPEESKARSLAIFLKNCTRIDKRLLGDFISKPENLDVLREFMGLFDFKDVSAFVITLKYCMLIF